MKKELRIPVSDEQMLEKGLDFIETTLTEMGMKRRKIINAMLIAEESMVKCMEVGKPGFSMRIRITKVLADVTIRLSLPGTEPLSVSLDELSMPGTDDADSEETRSLIQDLILRSFEDRVKYNHRNGINVVTIMANEVERTFLYATIASLILGLVVGILFRFCLSESVTEMLTVNLFEPIVNIFMNALHMVVAPSLFFSVVICISRFSGAREFGRVFNRVFRMSILTTVIAMVVSVFLFLAAKPGAWGLATLDGAVDYLHLSITDAVDADLAQIPSVLDLVKAIVPNNIITPFAEVNTLQILFLAVIVGIAAGYIGKHSNVVQPLMEAFDSLVTVITVGISRVMPLVAFSSIVLLLTSNRGKVLLAVLNMTVLQIVAFILMMICYGLMVLFGARLNPILFFRKIFNGMGISFSLCSSNAAVPTNLKICEKKLGIDPKVSSLSIPFGATFNMDGSAIGFIITTMFMIRIFGMDYSMKDLVFLVLMTLLLSFQTPGVPGAGIVAQSALLVYFGVPIEAMGMILGTNAILEMFATMSNTTGDLAVTTVVASHEKAINRELFNNKERI